MRVIKADVELGRSCQASWSAQFQLAARELMGVRYRKSRTPRGGGRPSSLTADGLSGVSHIIIT
ncbi:hypothetical protein HaLaN_20659 [Haematococcus lacustris]|uniref:Uncharacterized protein n=1 Tax=Haematococcus lacustris TaxID=44745 RepID=A0A699ZPL8_HAELA|nr:hypothetical protein HaLaN_20659 [Haematococcus lacustris]